MSGYVIAGIGTDIGKTVVAAVLVEALDADYWKPVPAGSLDDSDAHAVQRLAPGAGRRIHKEVFRLSQPLSPHAAADIDGVLINRDALVLPRHERALIVEIAGGLMVPLAPGLLNIDLLADWGLPIILVSQYYLGSINHTLLSIDALRQRKLPIAGIVLNGPTVESTRSVILAETGLPVIIELPSVDELNPRVIRAWAKKVKL